MPRYADQVPGIQPGSQQRAAGDAPPGRPAEAAFPVAADDRPGASGRDDYGQTQPGERLDGDVMRTGQDEGRPGPDRGWPDPNEAWPDPNEAWPVRDEGRPARDGDWPDPNEAWPDQQDGWPVRDEGRPDEHPQWRRQDTGWPDQDEGWPVRDDGRNGRDASWPDQDEGWPLRDDGRQHQDEGRNGRNAGWPDRGGADAGPGSDDWVSATDRNAAPGSLIRGFAPVPGEPVPLYGYPFTAWNPEPLPEDRGRNGPRSPAPDPRSGAAAISASDFDTDYSIPEVVDRDSGAQDRPPDDSQPALLAAESGASRRRRPGTRGRPAGADSAAADRPLRGRREPGASQRSIARPDGRLRAGKRGRPQVKLAIGAAVLIVVAAVTYLALGNGQQPQRPGSGLPPPAPSASPPAASPSLGPWGHIAARTTDPVALSVPQLFPPSFTSAGGRYIRTATRQSTPCSGALVGSGLQRAAKQAGCSQVLRASYLSTQAKVMGTIGVLNLRSYQAAARAGRAAGPADYIAQLAAVRGPTHRLGNGTGIEEALVKGHYVILVWAEFTSLRAPSTVAQRAALGTFMNLLIQQTANVSLSYRMVTGKPSAPPA